MQLTVTLIQATKMTANFTVAEGENKDDVDGGLYKTAELGRSRLLR